MSFKLLDNFNVAKLINFLELLKNTTKMPAGRFAPTPNNLIFIRPDMNFLI